MGGIAKDYMIIGGRVSKMDERISQEVIIFIPLWCIYYQAGHKLRRILIPDNVCRAWLWNTTSCPAQRHHCGRGEEELQIQAPAWSAAT